MVEYYCMLVDNIHLLCWFCGIILGAVMGSAFATTHDCEWDKMSDNEKTAFAIMAGVISLSILTLLVLPTSDVLRAMISE